MSADPALPGWFLEAFVQALARMGKQLVRWEGDTAVVKAEKGALRFGLENVYRKTLAVPEEQRVGRIVEHLKNLQNVGSVSSLAAARERLFPRLRTPIEEELARKLWWIPFQDTGLIVILVIDHPDAMTYVTRKMVEESGRSAEDWLDLATDNLRLITSSDLIVEVDDAGLLAVGTADAYDAVRGLLLEQFVPDPDPQGYIASVPNRDRLYFYPVAGNPFNERFAQILIETMKEHQHGSYAICDTVFWIHQGEWHEVTWNWDGENLTVGCPEGLKALLL